MFSNSLLASSSSSRPNYSLAGNTDDILDWDDAQVKIYVPAPGLSAEVGLEVGREDEIAYDWSIVKSAEPTEVTLDQGEEEEIGYTIEVSKGEAYTTDSTYTVTVNVSVSNTGQGVAQGVKVTLTIPELSVLDTLADGITIGVGETKNYSKTYKTDVFNASYTATVDVTSSNNAALQVSKTANTPTDLNVVEEIDESATVNDLITNVPAGFSIDPATLAREWNLGNSDTLSYTLVLKNDNAQPGTYYLTNTATVTENDTREESSDDATVTILVPAPGLSAEVGLEVGREDEIAYDWSIVKSAEPTEVTLDQGEEEEIGYTIEVSKGEAYTTDSTYTVYADVSVYNAGPGVAQGVVIRLVISELGVDETLANGISIAVGETKDYTRSYESKSYSAGYNTQVIVTSTNGNDPTANGSASTPQQNVVNEIDESATVNDLITNVPAGFSIDPATLAREWNLGNSDTLSYTLVLKNDNAQPGTYYLTNTATVTENDTREESSDDATVTILVPAPGLSAEVGLEVGREDEIAYDWSIVKSAEPTEVTLDQGEEEEIGYTIEVSKGEAYTTDSTYTVYADVSVYNAGPGVAQGVVIRLVISELGVDETLANGISIAVGETKDYTRSYESKSYSAGYNAQVIVTSTNGNDPTANDSASTPQQNVVEEIDESATVNDLITNVPAGFSIDPTTLSRNWNLGNSDTLSYTLVLKNDNAQPGTYYLTNTATVTENDTREESSDDATVTILVPAPKLGAEVDVQVSREDEIAYDWSIVKSAEPTEVTLDQGEEEEIGYTIEVSKGEAYTTDSTYTVTVNVSVSNTGQGVAQGVKVTLTIPELSVLDTLADGITIGVGETKNYSKTYKTDVFNASYTATVDVTSSNNAALQVSKTANTPTDLNVVEEIDESATVNDLITNVPAGFSIDPTTLSRNWNLGNSDTLSYTLVLKNDNAQPGTYYLTNTATVTENDTREESSDDATVTILVPAPKLGAEVDVQVSREDEIAYDWSIVKSAEPTEVTLDQGEEEEIGYTIEVSKGEAYTTDSTYTVTVNVSVSNTGQGVAQGVKVTLTIPELSVLDTLADGITIGVGETKNYSKTYKTDVFNASYTATVDVTSSNNAALQVSKTANTPTDLNVVNEIDESATVNDLITNVPAGFSIDPTTLSRNWNLGNSDTLSYTLVLKNDNAQPGTYYLTNTATVTENDTREESSDDATVTILVPAPGLSAEVGLEVGREDEIAYDWSIVKSAEPTEVILDQGEEEEIGYTIEVSKGEAYTTDSTYTVYADVSVYNAGPGVAQGVVIRLVISELGVDETLANGISIAVGETKDYTRSYESKSYSAGYNAQVIVTSTNGNDPTANDSASTPQQNVVNEIDESATVNDLITNVPAGFSIDPATLSRNWNLGNSDTLSYTLVLKNDNAQPGTYYLTNTATVTENDTKEESSDDATVTILVPAPGLSAEVGLEVGREDEIAYDWSIEKSAEPAEVTLDQGEEEEIGYTIEVSKGEAYTTDSTYTVYANVSVYNAGPGVAQGVVIRLVITELGIDETLANGISIAVGETKDYTRSYESKSYSAGYNAQVIVTSTNGNDPTASGSASTPQQNVVNEIDESATVNDLITNVPAGFSIDPATLSRNWNLGNSDTLSYTLVLKNDNAQPGTYYLTNTATVTEKDTKEWDQDEEEVVIEVPGLELELTAEMSWVKEQEYDWRIEKEADPTSLILDKGEYGEVSYTLTVTRESGQATYTYTIEGKVTLKNTGNTTLNNVAGTVELYADGALEDSDTFGPYTIAGLGSEESSFSFEVVSSTPIASFKVEASADSDETASVEEDEELTPSQEPDSLTEIDESADVIDEITQSPQGFEVTASKEPREWSLDDSDTLSYTLTITNESAEPGTYYLTNTATVTENDTREESSDDATVTITVPETVKLKAEVEAEFTWNRERIYEWEIDKKVNPTSVTFDVDEFEKTIEYTITATKTLASEINTHTYSGNAVFTNNGNSQAENAKLLITLQYFDGTWIDLQSETEVILGSIPSGASASYSFGPISFTPVQNIIEYRVKAVAIADAPANSDEAYDSSTLTVTGSTETNASAVLNDSFTEIPEGFAIVETDPDPLPFPQTITENTTVVFEITLAKFFYSGSSSITYEMNKLGAYLKANVTGYMAGEYPGWCTEVGVSGIGTSAVIESIYINGAPDAKYAKINYILNRYRDGLYSTSVDYRHIQIAIWAIMEGYLNWSWRSTSGISPEVPYGDKALVENIITTADENFLPGCGDVVLVRAKNASTQDLILEMEFPCGEEYELKNRATLKSETQDLWDDAIVTITLTPTEPEIFDIDLIAGYSMEKNTTYRWEIDKNVTPASAELEKTKSTTFVYTLVADRYLVSVSRKVQGSVVISNTGTGDLLNVSVKITLKGDGTVLNTYETTISLLSAGGSEVVPYSLDLSTGQYSNYTIETRAVEMASGVSDFDSTVLVPTEVKHNETADVRDEFTNLSTFTGNGFAIAPSTNPRIWMDIIRNVLWTAVDSNTWRTSFNIAVTNNTAAPGTYVLNNEVDIYDEDQVFDEDSASITITVRGGTWGEETAWGGNYPGGGSSWWYYFDTNGPSVQDIYAGQNLIQGASVKYDKAMGKLIITLGPNMRLQSVSDPVKVQGYSSIPSSRPEPGTFTTYKGTSLVISVPYYRYFAIHLDVEVWSPSK